MVIGTRHGAPSDWPALEQSVNSSDLYPFLPSGHAGTSEQSLKAQQASFAQPLRRWTTRKHTKRFIETASGRQMDCLLELYLEAGDPATDAFWKQLKNRKLHQKTSGMGCLEKAMIDAKIIAAWQSFKNEWTGLISAEPEVEGMEKLVEQHEQQHAQQHEQRHGGYPVSTIPANETGLTVNTIENAVDLAEPGVLAESERGGQDSTETEANIQTHVEEADEVTSKVDAFLRLEEQSNREQIGREQKIERPEKAERPEREEIRRGTQQNTARFGGAGTETTDQAPSTRPRTMDEILAEARSAREKEIAEKTKKKASGEERTDLSRARNRDFEALKLKSLGIGNWDEET